MISISNNIITMNRGDTFQVPLVINVGTKINPRYYTMTHKDTLYFAILEEHQPFECALIRKVFTIEDFDSENNVLIKLDTADTEHLLPGNYYYEIKLKHEEDENHVYVDTIVPRRKFIILK